MNTGIEAEVDWRGWFDLWVPVALLSAAVFVAFPGIDLAASALFAGPDGGFPLTDGHAVWVLRSVALALTGGVMVAVLAALLACLVRPDLRPDMLRPALFATSAFILGPGLLVNGILKRVSDRARPETIEAFGGPHPFQPFFDFSGPCATNCSFPSAETSAVAVAMMCLVLLVGPQLHQRARVILSAAAIAAMVTTAATRLALGAHFLSDVVGSLILMTALVPALHILFGLGRLSARRRAALG